MAAPAHRLSLAQVWVALMLALPARGGFLGGIKLENPTKFNPAKLTPRNLMLGPLSSTNLQKTLEDAEHQLPPAIEMPVKAQAVQEQIANSPQLAQGLHMGEAIEANAEKATADAQHVVANLVEQGAGAAGVSAADLRNGEAIAAKAEEATAGTQHAVANFVHKGAGAAGVDLEDVSVANLRNGEAIKAKAYAAAGRVRENAAAVADAAVRQAAHVVNGLHSGSTGGGAGVLRGMSSQLAYTVNRTSLHLSEFVFSFSPKASAMLRHSGRVWACQLSGKCGRHDVVPFDVKDPESWAVWGFALVLVLVLCATTIVVLGCTYAAGRKGTILLTEALVPLTSASAREPTLQMSARGLL